MFVNIYVYIKRESYVCGVGWRDVGFGRGLMNSGKQRAVQRYRI